MGEDKIAVIIVLGVFAAVFLPLGIYPLVQYFRLMFGSSASAVVVEHICEETRTDRRQVGHVWLLKLKYYVNGMEYVNKYSVCKKRNYMDAHPVDTKMKILVNTHDPKKFILPEDRWILLLMGGMFSLGGIASLIAALTVWIG